MHKRLGICITFAFRTFEEKEEKLINEKDEKFQNRETSENITKFNTN